jgi:hypothetical protein
MLKPSTRTHNGYNKCNSVTGITAALFGDYKGCSMGPAQRMESVLS